MSIIYITVGKLGRTRGVRGELYVTPFTDFPERFVGMTEIYVKNRSEWELKKIESSKLVGKRPVIKFEAINSPEDAAVFTNRELAVTKEQLVQLPEGSFYLFDLVGCDVYDETAGTKIGSLVEVEQYPANDVYTIETDDGKRLKLPVVKSFVKRIDIEAKKIEIDPAGLFE